MSLYGLSGGLDDPYWACYYGNTEHPLYNQCDKCPRKDGEGGFCNLPHYQSWWLEKELKSLDDSD